MTVLTRIARWLVASVASLLALLVVLILLGAYFPAIPKAGLAGPVLAGQWPVHLLGLALVTLGLAALTRRNGLARTGRILVVATLASTVATAVIIGTQVRSAQRAGSDLAWGDVFTELAYPDVQPDLTTTYASPDGKPLEVDVYLPESPDRARPAIVLAHAGGFRTFDKSDLGGHGRWLADRGVAVFAIDYRLATADRPTCNQAPQDLVCALGWVGENTEEFSVDPSRISLGGMSAGGILAFDAAFRLRAGTITSSCGEIPEAPASVVGFYTGVLDVAEMWSDDRCGSREAVTWFTGGTPEEVPERYRAVSPGAQLQANLMPTLLVIGDRDACVSKVHVERFSDALAARGVETQVEVLPFAVHAFDDAYGSIVAQASRQILLDFLTGTDG